MSDNNDTMMAVLLLGAAYVMTRRAGAATVTPVKTGTGGLTSLPANIGTGAGQAIGGALGNLIGSWFSSGNTATTSTGAGANGGGYVSDIDSGSSTDWSLPIGGGDTTDGDWWDVIA